MKKTDESVKFVYKPPLDLKAPKKTHLLNLLKSRHEKCDKTITMDEVRDTIPPARAEKFILSLIESGDVVKVPNSSKKDVLFYTDQDNNLKVNKGRQNTNNVIRKTLVFFL